MADKIASLTAIKRFMERSDNLCVGAEGRKVGMDEIKALSADDRKSLGELAAAQLGVEIQA